MLELLEMQCCDHYYYYKLLSVGLETLAFRLKGHYNFSDSSRSYILHDFTFEMEF